MGQDISLLVVPHDRVGEQQTKHQEHSPCPYDGTVPFGAHTTLQKIRDLAAGDRIGQ